MTRTLRFGLLFLAVVLLATTATGFWSTYAGSPINSKVLKTSVLACSTIQASPICGPNYLRGDSIVVVTRCTMDYSSSGHDTIKLLWKGGYGGTGNIWWMPTYDTVSVTYIATGAATITRNVQDYAATSYDWLCYKMIFKGSANDTMVVGLKYKPLSVVTP